jgi:MFS family permease
VYAIWNLGTGCFNPFVNTYWAHMRLPVARIGLIFSGSQLAQVVCILLAPLVLRKWGVLTGTAAMMMATALALVGLATTPAAAGAVVLFISYTAVQYMSDPGINTLLMGRVREQERSGAAALMMLASFAAQFVSAPVAGASITRFGYPLVLVCGAGLAAIAAVAYGWLPREAPTRTVQPELLPASANDIAPN